jgi:hypothetical protein
MIKVQSRRLHFVETEESSFYLLKVKTKGRKLFKFGIVISVVSVIVAGHYPDL